MIKTVPKKRDLGRHLGFLSDLGEFRFKMWLDANAKEALGEIGVK